MKYRREIDGLRAVAVLPVILFHAGFGAFSGGFVGVDVFFVISGYLITSILITQLDESQFSIVRFYERRARRILPALFIVIFACLPFAYMWMLPAQLTEFAHSVVAAVFFASNALFIKEDGYFMTASELKPLLHTWSLAVEGQFYLIFPIFLAFGWRFGRSYVFWIVVSISVLGLLLSEWSGRVNPSANFYSISTRMWELLAGSICGFLAAGRQQKSNNFLSVIGLALIVFSVFYFDSEARFPSVYTLAPVVGTTLIILFASPKTLVAKILSTRAFVGIGLISYSAYLWHQPLFAFARLRSPTEPSVYLMALLIIAVFPLAWATYCLVEKPIGDLRFPVIASRRSVFLASGAVGAAFIVFGVAGHFTKGFEWRSNGEVDFASLDARVVANYGLLPDCFESLEDFSNCSSTSTPNVLLWGDSYAMHLAEGILASDSTITIQQFTRHSCSPIVGISQLYTQEFSRDCIEFNDQVMNWLQSQSGLRLVVLSSPFSHLLGTRVIDKRGSVIHDSDVAFIAAKLLASVSAIRETGAKVVIVSPTPRSGWDIGQCLIRSVFFDLDEANCDFPRYIDPQPRAVLLQVSDEVSVYWLEDDICDDVVCNVMQDGVFIYRDFGHLSKEGSAYLGRKHDWMHQFRAMAN